MFGPILCVSSNFSYNKTLLCSVFAQYKCLKVYFSTYFNKCTQLLRTREMIRESVDHGGSSLSAVLVRGRTWVTFSTSVVSVRPQTQTETLRLWFPTLLCSVSLLRIHPIHLILAVNQFLATTFFVESHNDNGSLIQQSDELQCMNFTGKEPFWSKIRRKKKV